MLRYYKRNAMLAAAAILITILTRLLTPVAAVLEQQIIDTIIEGDFNAFYKKLIAAGIIVAVAALIYWVNAVAQKDFQTRFEEDLRNDLYDGMLRQSYVFFKEKDTAEILSYIKNQSSTISNNFTGPVFVLIGIGAMAIALLVIILYYSPVLALVCVSCAGLSIALPLYFNKKLNDNLMTKVQQDVELTKVLKESLNGYETIISFNILSCIGKIFKKVSRNYRQAQYRLEFSMSLLENVTQVMQKIIWFVSYLVAGTMAVRRTISVGTLVMFVTLLTEFDNCVAMYAQVVPLLSSSKHLIKKLLNIVDYQKVDFTGTKEPKFETELCVKKLSFRYSEGTPLIDNLNFTIRKGEKVSIIGSSGCGKTTFIKLLCGYYPGYQGDICYDGTELKELDVVKLRRIVTVIHQDTFMFNASIRFNICFGEEFDEAVLQNALQCSGVARFLPSIEGGLDGECGENGSKLSGGQKQRVALARAIIRGVNLLVLDESVSAIDVETANEIESDILNMKDLTLITITHRIKDGLLEKYDRVIDFENMELSNTNRKLTAPNQSL